MSIQSCRSFILGSRLENVVAFTVSLALTILFLTTRLFHDFNLGMHDFIFILLPAGVLAFKAVLGLLLARPAGSEESDPGKFLSQFVAPFWKIFRDWFPFLLLSACYFSLYSNLMLRVNPHTADAFLAGIDARIFGAQPSLALQPFIHPWLTDFMSVVYFSFVLYFPGVALWLYLRKEHQAFRRLMMGYLTLILLGVISYLAVPAVGPETFFASSYTSDLHGQAMSHGVEFIMKNARVGHDCFPSLHVGIPLLLALYLRDFKRKLFIPAVVYVGLMCGATIYLRYHYVVDVAAAFIYAPVAYRLNNFVLSRWPGERAAGAAAIGTKSEDAGTASPGGLPVPAGSCA
jgi:membrane-associated phospholipid phosphatase